MQRRSQNQKILNLLDSLQGLSICLIGMMGSGKSTIGKELSIQLNYRFFDTDILIEQVIGRKIPDIFATDGEAQFRDWESQILSNVTACTRSVIATGGRRCFCHAWPANVLRKRTPHTHGRGVLGRTRALCS